MTARDTAHYFDMVCPHLTALDRRDGLRCDCQPASWDHRQPPTAAPWWRSSDGEMSWPAVLLILAITGACVLAALVVGQRWQDERCAAVAGTTSACGSVTA